MKLKLGDVEYTEESFVDDVGVLIYERFGPNGTGATLIEEMRDKLIELNKVHEGFIILGSTGCSCCRNENFVEGIHPTIESARSSVEYHTQNKTVRSQYSATGVYTIQKCTYRIMGDNAILLNGETALVFELEYRSRVDGDHWIHGEVVK